MINIKRPNQVHPESPTNNSPEETHTKSIVDQMDRLQESGELLGEKKTLSVTIAVMMIAGTIAGSGILALPRAVEETGWIGFLLIAYFSGLAAYTGLLLGDSWMLLEQRYAHELRAHIQDPYPMIGEKAFGLIGRILVKIFVYLATFGGGVVFLLLASDIIVNLIKTLGNADFSLCYVTLILGAVFIPLSWLGTPSDFWGMGVAALLSTASACALITAYTVYLRFEHDEQIHHPPVSAGGFMMSLGSIAFTLAGHPSFPTIQQDMTERKKFRKAVFIAFLIVAIMYLIITISSYFLLGDLVGPNILNTLSDIASSWPVTVSQFLLLIHLITGYLVVINPISQDLEDIFKIPNRFGLWRVIIRTLVICAIIFTAETIPRFAIILSLVGGSAITMIIFILPVLMYESLCRQKGSWPAVPIPVYRTVLHAEIVIIGIVIMITSTYSAVLDITGPSTFVPPCYVNVSSAHM